MGHGDKRDSEESRGENLRRCCGYNHRASMLTPAINNPKTPTTRGFADSRFPAMRSNLLRDSGGSPDRFANVAQVGVDYSGSFGSSSFGPFIVETAKTRFAGARDAFAKFIKGGGRKTPAVAGAEYPAGAGCGWRVSGGMWPLVRCRWL